MSSLRLFIISGLLCPLILFAQNSLILNNLNAYTSDTAWVDVDVQNADDIVGFQFDLYFPYHLSYSGVSYLSERSNGHELVVQSFDDHVRLMAYNLTLNPFLSDSGTVVTIGLLTSNVYGNYPLEIENAILGDALSQNIISDVINGDIRITPIGGFPVWHVSTIGSDEDGSGNAESPFSTIQFAIDQSAYNDTVLVMPGHYNENINFNGHNIVLISKEGPDSTIIDADGNGIAITFNSDESNDAVLSGFHITGGVGDNNSAGILINGAGPIINHCLITGNFSANGGSAITLQNANDVVLENLTIADNVNGISNSEYHGAIKHISGTARLTNSILYNNENENELVYDQGFIAEYSLFNSYNGSVSQLGSGNIIGDPLFVNPDSGNYHLRLDSPCLNSGNPDLDGDGISWEADIHDQDADGTQMDMGALPHYYEIPPGEYVEITMDTTLALIGDTVKVHTYLRIPDAIDVSAMELIVSGLNEDLTFLGLDTVGSVLAEDEWIYQTNIINNELHVAFAGSENFYGEGLFFTLTFVVNETVETFYPIQVSSLILNTGGLPFHINQGGVEVLIIHYGDIDMNGLVQAYDASQILQYLIGDIDFGLQEWYNADITEDSTVSAIDASLVMQYVVDLIDELPVEQVEEGGAEILLSNSYVNPGDTTEVLLYISEGNNVLGFDGELEYDPQILTYHNIIWSDLIEDFTIKKKIENGKINFAGAGVEPDGNEGVFARVQFIVNESFEENTNIQFNRLRWNEEDVLVNFTETNLELARDQNTLIVNDLEVYTGDTAWVTIDMENQDEIVGFQFDFSFPDHMTYSGVSFLSDRANDHELIVQQNEDDIRFLAYNFTLDPFSDNSGTLITIGLLTSEAYGNFDLEINQPILGNYLSQNLMTSFENGNIFITPADGYPKWHVSVDGSNENLGTQGNPFATIQFAIDHAEEFDTVFVHSGTYFENINYNGKNIAVIGEDRETTIIDGGENGSTVIINGNSIMSGFKIINASDGPSEGGIKCEGNFSPIIDNNFITQNNRNGIYINPMDSPYPLISNNIIKNNDMGIYIYGGSGFIDLSTVIKNNNISENSDDGIYLQGYSNISPKIINNTIVLNGRYGIMLVDESNPVLINNIIYENGVNSFEFSGQINNPALSFNNIYGGFPIEGINEGGNIYIDPIFTDPENGDFTLQPSSPCIDTGDPSITDPDGTISDIGAYYFDQIQTPIIDGCMDEIALNYNPDANVEDNSCEYYSGPIWYVSNEGTDEFGYGSESTPFATIQYGVDALEDGDTIFINNGVYQNNFHVENKSVSIIGENSDSTFFEFQESTNFNITSTSQKYVEMSNITIIPQGNMGYTTGLGSYDALDTLNIIFNNIHYIDQIGSRAIEVQDKVNLTLNNCSFQNLDDGGQDGAAIKSADEHINHIIINDSEFIGNQSNQGGAIFVENPSSMLEVYNSLFDNNYADSQPGGAICFRGDSLTIINTVFVNNQSSTLGGAVYLHNSNAYIKNNTFFNNQANEGGAIYVYINNSIDIVNSILYGNSPDQISSPYDNSNINITYSNIEGSWEGVGNINADPQFNNPENGDFTLQLTSPCINAGNPDLDGDGISWQSDEDDQDIYGTRFEMGAFPEAGYSDILPPIIISNSHPDSNVWISDNDPYFTIEPVENASGYMYLLDNEPETQAFYDNSSFTSNTTIAFEDLSDGIWYLHVSTLDEFGIIGEYSNHYQIQIDTNIDSPLISSNTHSVESQQYPFTTLNISYEINDFLSGMDYLLYSFNQEEDSTPVDTINTQSMTFEDLVDGTHYFHFQAFDNAGNSSEIIIFQVNVNTPPILVINSPTSGSSYDMDVSISYSITDILNDVVDINISYSIDQGENWINTNSITGPSTGISVDEYDNTLVWNSFDDIPNTEYDNILIAITPSDSISEGIQAISESFHLDNNIPPQGSISQLSGEYSGDIPFIVQIDDMEEDDVTYEIEYSIDHQLSWLPATISLENTSYFGVINISEIRIDTLHLDWLSAIDIPDIDIDSVYLKVSLADNDPGEFDISPAFQVDNYHNQSIDITEINEEQTGNVLIDYTITDITNDAISIFPYYSTDSGNNWNVANVDGDTEINSENYTSSIIWESIEDLPSVDLNNVLFKIEIADNWQNGFSDNISLHLDNNEPPQVGLSVLSGEYSNDISFNIEIDDVEEDQVTYQIEYSIDDQLSWNPATISLDQINYNQVELNHTRTEIVNLIWSSHIDIIDQDIGTVYLKVSVFDNDPGEVEVGTVFSIDNYHNQSILINEIVAEQSGDVLINYQITDITDDSINLTFEYSIDNGESWVEANVEGLDIIEPNQYSGNITWISNYDLPGLDMENIMFKITPSDQWQIGFSDSIIFHVDNNYPPELTLYSPAEEVNDTVQFSFSYLDPEMDDVTFICQYKIEGSNWQNAQITTNQSPGDVSVFVDVYWPSLQLGYNDEQVKLKVSLFDNDPGQIDSTNYFNVDNYHEHSIQLSDIGGENSGNININYFIQDFTEDLLNVVLSASADLGDTWQIIGNINSIESDEYVGSYQWNSENTFPGIDNDSLLISALIYDQWQNGEGDQISLYLDNNMPPTASIEIDLYEVAGDKIFNRSYVDQEGDEVDWTYKYSIDYGETWLDPTIENGPDYYIWKSQYDIPNYESSNVLLKVTPYDIDEGISAISDYFHIDNDHSSVEITLESAEYSSDINIPLILSDMGQDSLSILLEYLFEDNWYPATVSGQVDLITNYAHEIVWNSVSDINNVDILNLMLRITSSDEWSIGNSDSILIHLDNEIGPTYIEHSSDINLRENIEVSFSVPLADQQFSDHILIESEHDSNITEKINFMRGSESNKLLISLDSTYSWVSMDTLTITIKNSLIDSLGKGFDGNNNGDPEFNESDDYTIAVNTSLLADYNADFIIDFNDLQEFVSAWYAKDYSLELGPSAGTVPHLIPVYDSSFDIEDLASFIRMWNWSDAFASPDLAMTETNGILPEFEIEDNILSIILEQFENVTSLHIKVKMATLPLMLNSLQHSGYDINLEREWIEEAVYEINLANLTNEIEENKINLFSIENLNQDQITLLIEYKLIDLEGLSLAEGIYEMVYIPLPDQYYLNRAFPNPFNPITNIEFGLPVNSDLSLNIYNIQGRLVKTLIKGNRDAGKHSIEWNAGGLSSGIYFIKMTAGEFSQSQKLMLVK